MSAVPGVSTAVLFNAADQRVGSLQVPDDADIVDYDGCFFIRTDKQAQADGAWVAVFEAPTIHRADRVDP